MEGRTQHETKQNLIVFEFRDSNKLIESTVINIR